MGRASFQMGLVAALLLAFAGAGPGLAKIASTPLSFASASAAQLAVLYAAQPELKQDLETAAKVSGQPATVEAAQVDLDGKPGDEFIFVIRSRIHCGQAGCPVIVLRATTPPQILLGDVIAHEVAVAETRSNGLRTLVLNGASIWRFDGKRYDFSKR